MNGSLESLIELKNSSRSYLQFESIERLLEDFAKLKYLDSNLSNVEFLYFYRKSTLAGIRLNLEYSGLIDEKEIENISDMVLAYGGEIESNPDWITHLLYCNEKSELIKSKGVDKKYIMVDFLWLYDSCMYMANILDK